jgi:hypothetical protein
VPRYERRAQSLRVERSYRLVGDDHGVAAQRYPVLNSKEFRAAQVPMRMS